MRIIRIGLLLGWRQIQRASKWTTLLIISVMMLTFLNLIAVSGVLVGLIEGAERAVRAESLGDIILSEKSGENNIIETASVLRELATYPEIEAYTARYQGAGQLEANYKERRSLSAERDTATVNVTGIDPLQEEKFSSLSKNITRGEYLDPSEEGYILIGYYYLDESADKFGDLFDTLAIKEPGETVRLTVGNVSKEFIVKGIVESKVDDVSLNTYIPEREFRRLFDRIDNNADRILIRVGQTGSEADLKTLLLQNELDKYAKIQTFDEGKPKFITDIKSTMNLLGTFIGSIGIVVASITIFIIIFINALSRRQQIGILKGIGIDRSAIEVAYVFQAAVYAIVGSGLGALLTYGFLLGYFERNPIKFPFSDGVLVAPPEETFLRFIVLFVVTLAAGFLPAWMIVKQNTLNSILGRK
ncbi:MAG: FtsX-like permease family protein [Candidatus Kaiserbacteria bacterium]|nr:FtsX-like permease family protein [Candidatus Kaiserbacteria bacterium]MCB9816863.1 FtsX-like permease family protein [Candidatus Nomurabacteria bacterium]